MLQVLKATVTGRQKPPLLCSQLPSPSSFPPPQATAQGTRAGLCLSYSTKPQPSPCKTPLTLLEEATVLTELSHLSTQDGLLSFPKHPPLLASGLPKLRSSHSFLGPSQGSPSTFPPGIVAVPRVFVLGLFCLIAMVTVEVADICCFLYASIKPVT